MKRSDCNTIHDARGRARARTYMVDTRPDDAVPVSRLDALQQEARDAGRCSVCNRAGFREYELDDSARCERCAP